MNWPLVCQLVWLFIVPLPTENIDELLIGSCFGQIHPSCSRATDVWSICQAFSVARNVWGKYQNEAKITQN
jgi:hypothetical protein